MVGNGMEAERAAETCATAESFLRFLTLQLGWIIRESMNPLLGA